MASRSPQITRWLADLGWSAGGLVEVEKPWPLAFVIQSSSQRSVMGGCLTAGGSLTRELCPWTCLGVLSQGQVCVGVGAAEEGAVG